MNKLFVFLKRIRHCRGFGIQSPSDFAFINEVIYQRSPYYAYADLDRQFPDASWFERKCARTLFRVCNYIHPSAIVVPIDTPPIITSHLTAACPNATVSTSDDGHAIHLDSTLILPGIHKEGAAEWKQLITVRHQQHLILFDLYYFGIAIPQPKRYSEHYLVNFY